MWLLLGGQFLRTVAGDDGRHYRFEGGGALVLRMGRRRRGVDYRSSGAAPFSAERVSCAGGVRYRSWGAVPDFLQATASLQVTGVTTGSWERCLFWEEEHHGCWRSLLVAERGPLGDTGGVRYRSLGAVPCFLRFGRRRLGSLPVLGGGALWSERGPQPLGVPRISFADYAEPVTLVHDAGGASFTGVMHRLLLSTAPGGCEAMGEGPIEMCMGRLLLDAVIRGL